MRKFLNVVAVTICFVTGLAPSASAAVRPGDACRFQNRQSAVWTRDEVRWTVKCLSVWMNVDTGHALYVANRESKFDRLAWNHSSDCRGIFQHMYRYWWTRVASAGRKLNKFKVHDHSWTSPRAQAVVTFTMVKRGGWGPWGG